MRGREFWLSWLLVTVMASEEKKSGGKVLLLGGTGFIGGTTAMALLEEGFELTLTARGNWGWDWGQSLAPRVRFVPCDRSDVSGRCQELLALLDRERDFLAVVDFSAYKLKALEPLYEALAKSCRRLIYISSDSVYEVCKRGLAGPLLREEAAIRPDSEDERTRLNRLDSYGHHKLAVEEWLTAQSEKDGALPFVALRLPDVLGQRDSTLRFWQYQLWLQHTHTLRRRIPIPSHLAQLHTSSVYVRDVAAAVALLLREPPDSPNLNTAFNIAFPQPRTLRQLLAAMAAALARQIPGSGVEMEAVIEEGGSGPFMFPSVTRGAVDSAKFVRAFPTWRPTDFTAAIDEIVAFNLAAAMKFPAERDEAALDLLEDLDIPKDHPRARQFLAAVRAPINEHAGTDDAKEPSAKRPKATEL